MWCSLRVVVVRENAQNSAKSSAGAQLGAGLVGVVFLLLFWAVTMLSALSGLLWRMPPDYGGLGWKEPGASLGVASVALAAGIPVLLGLHRVLRAMRVHRPVLVLLTGGPVSLALCAGLQQLIVAPRGPTATEVEVIVLVLFLLIGFGTFAVLARVLPARRLAPG